jgi:hypothetical protein
MASIVKIIEMAQPGSMLKWRNEMAKYESNGKAAKLKTEM